MLTIRYEDFLSRQHETLETVCDFLGIAFLPQMLDVAASAEARQIAQLSSLWSANCHAPITANIDKFRQQLSDDEINLIETLAGPYMDRYGYTRLARGDAGITPALIELAGVRSAQGRERAWRALEQDNFRDYALRRCRADYLAQLHARLSQSGGAPDSGAIVTLDPLDPDAFVVDD